MLLVFEVEMGMGMGRGRERKVMVEGLMVLEGIWVRRRGHCRCCYCCCC